MHKPIALLLTGTLILSSCGTLRDSRINPRNWFGSSREVAVRTPAENVNPLIPEEEDKVKFNKDKSKEDTTILLRDVTDLRVEQTSTGAIIYAAGLPTRQGAYDVHLRRREGGDDSVLELEFRVAYPEQATQRGSEFSRTVRAAYSLSRQELNGIGLIRVIGADTARETRRR